jgi:hypothetical protein
LELPKGDAMPLVCKFEELDDATREYLHDVRTRKGRGTPGIYVPAANPWPLLALIFGPLVGLVLLVWGLSSAKPAWAVALLETAGFLIAGWSVTYAVRRWMAGRGRVYGGHFAYFDPLYAYQVNGEVVTITSLKSVSGVGAVPPGDNRPSLIEFELQGDRTVTIPVRSLSDAQLVEEYYAALDDLEHQKEGAWANSPYVELGAAAKYAAEEDELPPKSARLDLDFDAIPDDPGRAHRAGLGVPMLLAIPLAALALYGLLWLVNIPVGDELAFDRAKEDGAPGLRGYLLDERNTRHRDEATRLLAKTYDAPIARLKSLPPGQQPELRDGMVKLVESLRTTTTPVVSIVVEKKKGDATATSDGIANQLRTEVADGLARAIGPKLIAFAQPAQGKPAHLTIRYEIQHDRGRDNVSYDVEIRLDPESAPIAHAAWTDPTPLPFDPRKANEMNLNQMMLERIQGNDVRTGAQEINELKQRLCKELVGEFRPPPMNFGGGDF